MTARLRLLRPALALVALGLAGRATAQSGSAASPFMPPAAAMASNQNKHKKSNNCDDQQSRQKKQRKLSAISKKQQKHPAISDINLEKQLNRVRDASLQNVADYRI